MAEDLTQEALARAWERWTQVQQARNPSAWIYRVAFNLAASWFRRRAAEVRARQRSMPTSPVVPEGTRRIEFFDARPGPSEDVDGDAADAEPRRISERDIVLEGEVSGRPWMLAVWLAENQTVCVELGGVSCGSLPEDSDLPWSAGSTTYPQGRGEVPSHCAYGVLAPQVDRVRLDLSDGTSVELEPASTSLEIPLGSTATVGRGQRPCLARLPSTPKATRAPTSSMSRKPTVPLTFRRSRPNAFASRM